MEFKSLEELYERLKPALKCKRREMIKQGFDYIKIEDIWNYLKEVKWKNDKDLCLYDMVSDVLNVENAIIDRYLKQKLNSNQRQIYFGE